MEQPTDMLEKNSTGIASPLDSFDSSIGQEWRFDWNIEFDDDDDDDDDDKDDLELECVPDTGPTTLNQAYTCICTAKGGDPPYTIALDPKHNTLPSGLTFTAVPGSPVATIAGTPNKEGPYTMYRVFAIDTGGGYADHEFDAGEISASSAVGTCGAAAHALFAGLGDPSAGVTPEQIQYVGFALGNLDPETGKAPSSEANPNAKNLGAAEIAAADNAVQRWLRLGDAELWENLHTALEEAGNTISLPLQVQIIQLCKRAKNQTVAERKAAEAYHKNWPQSSRVALVKELAKTSSVAEMCSYMSTYRPSGLLITPPFDVAADAVLIAIAHKWPKLH
jgi:hypothetical protein